MRFNLKSILIITTVSITTLIILSPKFMTHNYTRIVVFNSSSTNRSFEELDKLLHQIIDCRTESLETRVGVHGNYTFIRNFMMAEEQFDCHSSITYATISDVDYLDNLQESVWRWYGPVSVAVYAPGDDYDAAVSTIMFLKNCDEAIGRFVSFHIFAETQYFTTQRHSTLTTTCDKSELTQKVSFRSRNNLSFPINVARNLARQSAQTHFVLSSDIELYPSLDIIPNFLNLVANNPTEFNKTNQVFVLPVFEVAQDISVPEIKMELEKLFIEQSAKWVHANICYFCHRIPDQEEWLKAGHDDSLNVFRITKRKGLQKYWEPFFIGTKQEPLFDERLLWEGESDKMSQGYSLCLLDYDFAILDNAFLVHKPGFSTLKDKLLKNKKYKNYISNTIGTLKTIKQELDELYGPDPQCTIGKDI